MKTFLFIILSLFVSIVIRIVLPWSNIIGSTIKYNTVDAYYFVHLAELYPNIPLRDYSLGYPDGLPISVPLWSQIIGFIGNVEFTAVILPAILGVLSVIPVFFIAKAILSQKLAVVVTLFYSIMGGDLLIRTQLGAADHHALELFAFLYTMMFVVLFTQNKKWYWLLGAVSFFVLYFFAWAGWYVIPAIILLFMLWQVSQNIKGNIPIIAFVCCGIFGISLITIIMPDFYSWLSEKLIVISWNPLSTIVEEQPLLVANGRFETGVLWGQYGIVFYIALLGLGAFAYKYYRERKPIDLLFLAWTFIVLILAFAQRRFTMYLSLNLIILAVYFAFVLVKILPKQKMLIAVGLVILVVFPMISTSVNQVTDKRALITEGWVEVTQWLSWNAFLEKNTPNDWCGNKYMADWESFKHKNEYADYGVLSLWNYGYWIVQQGNSNAYNTPGSDNNRKRATEALLTTDEQWVADMMYTDNLRYIVIDGTMVTSKFNSMARILNLKDSEFFIDDNYKNTMVYRLYYGDTFSWFNKVFESESQIKINGSMYSEVVIWERHE